MSAPENPSKAHDSKHDIPEAVAKAIAGIQNATTRTAIENHIKASAAKLKETMDAVKKAETDAKKSEADAKKQKEGDDTPKTTDHPAPETTHNPPTNNHHAEKPKGKIVSFFKNHPWLSRIGATVAGLGVLGSGALSSAATFATGSYQAVMNAPIIGALAHSAINGGSIVLNGAANMAGAIANNVPILNSIVPAFASATTNVANSTGLSAALPGTVAPFAAAFLGLTTLGAIKRAWERSRGKKNKEYKNVFTRFIGTTGEGLGLIAKTAGAIAFSPIMFAGWSLAKIQTFAEKTLGATGKMISKQLSYLKPSIPGVGGAAIGAAIVANILAPGVSVAPLLYGAGGYLIGNYFARKNKKDSHEHGGNSHPAPADQHSGDGHQT